MKYSPESTKKEQELFNSLLDLKNKKVLEIGCGAGDYTLKIAPLVKELVAIDISEDVIEEAKKRNIPENVFFKVCDASKLDFKDKTFDCIFSAFTLHEADPKKQYSILKECHRVLKENGKFCILEITLEDPEILTTDPVTGTNHEKLVNIALDNVKKSVQERLFSKKMEKTYWAAYLWEDLEEAIKDIIDYLNSVMKKDADEKKIRKRLFEVLGKLADNKPIKAPVKFRIIVLKKGL
jgi:ubiquinone/menaquinone biosynthesis C-methylase UbiE